MKNRFIFIAFMLSLATFWSGCDHKEDHNNMEELNIDFPAAYVVNGEENSLSVINLTTNKEEHHIEFKDAKFPHHIYLSPNKELLAIAITATDLSGGHGGGHSGGSGDYKVIILDAVKGTIHHEIKVPHVPHNAAFSPDGKELWVGQMAEEGHILVFSTSDWKQLKEIPVGKSPSEITFATNGSKAYAANTEDGTISVIDPVAKTVITTLTVGTDPVGAWAGANSKMYVDNEGSKTVSEIDVATNKVSTTINLGFTPAYVAFNTKVNELWVSDTAGMVHFYTWDNATSSWKHGSMFNTGADAHAIVFSNDETKAYVSNQGGNTLSVVDVATHTKTLDIAVGKKPNGIALRY